jgi:hypothetical protein
LGAFTIFYPRTIFVMKVSSPWCSFIRMDDVHWLASIEPFSDRRTFREDGPGLEDATHVYVRPGSRIMARGAAA